jgi:catechol 2,3-dioxygenase-like lactoylglutathione lyase family enzyme
MPEAMTSAAARLKLVSPQFLVPDVVAAAEYYRDTLGFKILGYFLDPPVFAIVGRDSVEIQFGKVADGLHPSPNILRKEGSLDAYIWTDNLDALFAELKSRGAKIAEPPTVRIYNCYEMVVEDLFGFRLAFAMDYQKPA